MLRGAVRSKLRDPHFFAINDGTKAAYSFAPTYEPSFYEKPYNIRRQLFWIDSQGHMFPKYPPVPEIQKDVINNYVTVHGIPKEKMLDFWADYVDSLLCCHNFEEEAPPPFKAWAYGRLCRYVLLDRSKASLSSKSLPDNPMSMQSGEYDPVHNYSM